MTCDPAFADADDGMEMLMPDWFDDDFIQAVVDVGARLPGREQDHDHAVQHDHAVGAADPVKRSKRETRISKLEELAQRLRKEKA